MISARAIMGISEACYMPAAVALILDYHKGQTRSLASGIVYSGVYAGMALGGTGGYIAEYWGWRYGFHLFGIIGVAYAVILFIILRDAPKEEQKITETIIKKSDEKDEIRIGIFQIIRNLFKSRSYWVIIIYSNTWLYAPLLRSRIVINYYYPIRT